MTAIVSQQVAIGSKEIPAAVQQHTAETAVSVPLMTAPKSLNIVYRIPAIMKRIAFCESGGRQFDDQGNVIRGVFHPADIGKYQINLAVWEDEAKRLGYDLFSEEGNEAMAMYLYHQLGTQPWFSSSACWDKSAVVVEAIPAQPEK